MTLVNTYTFELRKEPVEVSIRDGHRVAVAAGAEEVLCNDRYIGRPERLICILRLGAMGPWS
jgi:hypothetical protein